MLLPLSYAPKKIRLGDVDSNHDRQSQNLPSCQLDDLPISNNQSRRWESNPHPAAYETAARAIPAAATNSKASDGTRTHSLQFGGLARIRLRLTRVSGD